MIRPDRLRLAAALLGLSIGTGAMVPVAGADGKPVEGSDAVCGPLAIPSVQIDSPLVTPAVRLGDVLARYYPERALGLEAEGSAHLDCTADHGLLRDCRVQATPANMGFDAAGLRAAQDVAISPQKAGHISLTLDFRIAGHKPCG